MVMILDPFLSKFSEFLVQMVQNEVGMLLGIPGQIEKLRDTIRDIQCILADAEMKKSKSSAIERWLMQLKDVMYDADDIIDLCQIKAKERLAGSSSHSSSNARCGCPLLSCFRNPIFAHKIGSKIKDINSRLDGIAKRKTELGLIESPISSGPSNPVQRVDSVIIRETDPSILLAGIVGEKIEEDTELLVNWLTKEETTELLPVATILGMGGIGKTTLAKMIINDPRIVEEFQLKIWVCISKEVKAIEVLKCVIREAGGEPGAVERRSELVPLLERTIQKKKFLLVLDDVWIESRTVWDNLLCAPMSRGAYGSRLLVTTRDERVANAMRTSKLHRVDKLSEMDGWSLLIKQVAPNGVESDIQDLMEIGMQIVKKCDGLPLAIKSIGGVLCTKGNTRGNWLAILESNVWSMDGLPGDVHRAFYLSYEDLPSPLKRCFISFSLFPEDTMFSSTELIYLWLAEGYLQDKVDFWELGLLYYKELLLRNFLEDTKKYHDQAGCKMHDLLWSFTRQLGKDENCILGNGQVLSKFDSTLKLRRLSIEGDVVNIEIIKKKKGLRTLLLRAKPEFPLDDLCKTVSKLRILDIGGSNISCLPDSLFGLVHLRYLDVRQTKLRTIPNAIGNLRNNLVFLNCEGCFELSHIPKSISSLPELRGFNLLDTKVKAIPAGLNNLENLRHLYGFKPYNNNSEGFSSLDGLESLSKLIVLYLDGLEKVSDQNMAKGANLRSKNKLEYLRLGYISMSFEEQLSQTNEKKMTSEEVLNELFPPPFVQDLEIINYYGTCLPNWLNLGAALPNLRHLIIENCACFEGMAPLGQLPNLEYLCIEDAYSVVNIGEEFLLGGIQSKGIIEMGYSAKLAFPKLSELIFIKMANWKVWEWNKRLPAMPKLKKLYIVECPQLRSLPDGLSHHATSLEYLRISKADNLITVENLPSVKEIDVWENRILERISNLRSISYIEISQCPNLKAVENLETLQRIALSDFEMESLPDYLAMTMPQKIRIDCSEELLRKIAKERESGSEWNKFKHIPKVTINSPDGSFSAIYQKTPLSFTTNIRTWNIIPFGNSDSEEI
ncbi:putative disease resistance protein RGA3 [Carex rostrata]